MQTFKINAFKAVSFKESAIQKVMELGGVIAAVKYDGLRCHLVITPTADIQGKPAARMVAMSRTDNAIPALRELFISDEHKILLGQLLEESLYPDGLVIDGEVMVKGVDFNTGSGMLRRKEAIHVSKLEYKVYGVLPLSALKDSPDAEIEVPYCVMYEQVKVLMHQLWELLPEMDWKQEETYEVYDMASLEELFKKVREEGHEGLIIKDPMTNWKRGKKTGYWKMKSQETHDGHVVGINWGTEGLANEGKVIGFQVLLESGRVVDANNATQAEMDEWTKLYNEHGESYFHNRAIEVKCMEQTPDGSLRHPSFQRWRDLEGAEGVKA